MISSEASKRDDYNAYCAGKKVGWLRIQKYIDRDRLIASLEESISKDSKSIHHFLLRSRFLFDVDVSYNILYRYRWN
jgi:hypothetical protein